MVKTLLKTLIILITAAIVVVGAKILTMILIVDLTERFGRIPVLVVSASGLLLFYALFFADFLRWFHRQTREDSAGKTRKIDLFQFLKAFLGAAFIAVIVGSTGAALLVAERVDTILFWSLLALFTILLFLSAYRFNKTGKQNNPHWWRG